MNFEILVFRISRISFIVYRFSWVLIRFYGFPFVVGRVLTVIELTFCNPHKKIKKNLMMMININSVT